MLHQIVMRRETSLRKTKFSAYDPVTCGHEPCVLTETG